MSYHNGLSSNNINDGKENNNIVSCTRNDHCTKLSHRNFFSFEIVPVRSIRSSIALSASIDPTFCNGYQQSLLISPPRRSQSNFQNSADRSGSPLMEHLQNFMESKNLTSNEDETTSEQHIEHFNMDGESLNQPSTSGISHLSLNEQRRDYQRTAMFPFMLQSDTKFSSLKSTRLLDQLISCFVVGGECRLCFPQMLAVVLPDVPVRQVDEVCQQLRIMNTQANKEQIRILKLAGSLPPCTANCELITKSNAERLVAHFLINGSPPLDQSLRSQLNFIQIAHDCFGGCTGRLYSSLAPNACIECTTCRFLFQPENFCRHIHPPITVPITSGGATSSSILTDISDNKCHWGFDSSNWAYYLHVDDEITNSEELEEQLACFVENYRNLQNANSQVIFTQANA